jgi:hypothetical protein
MFDEAVDATYVIYLEGNGRLDSIHSQLNWLHPTRRVFLLVNKGYKKCAKNETIQSPPQDLVDAFLHVFQHAQENQFGNILILEDDFEWNPELLQDSSHSKNIQDFLKKKQGERFVYRLGCIPYVMFPYDFQHWFALLSGGTHACIYSDSYRQSVLSVNSHTITDWDIFTNQHGFLSSYAYYRPTCYQLFPHTENSNFWGIENPVYFFFSENILKPLKRFVSLDTSFEPGYSFFYVFSKGFFFSCLFLFLFLFCFFLYRVFSFFGVWKRIQKLFFYTKRSKT